MEDGCWTFTRAPFGIKTVPGFFQNQLHKIFQVNGLTFCLIYIDDIIFGADTIDELADKLEQVLSTLDRHNIKLKAKKCCVGKSQVTYLGHSISKDKIAIDKDRIQAIEEIPIPRSAKELKSFLGATGWLRKFLEDYGSTAAVLHQLTRKDKQWEWRKEHQQAFVKIKKLITSEPILAPYKLDAYTVVRCDASRIGVGGVLLQGTNDDDLRPVAYVSKAFNDVQQRWDAFDMESYAIVHVLNKFRHFLIGRRFVLETDHRNLCHLQTASTSKIERWYLRVADFDFSVVHIPGRLNKVADFLSRHMEVRDTDRSYVTAHHALAMMMRQRPVMPKRTTRSSSKNAVQNDGDSSNNADLMMQDDYNDEEVPSSSSPQDSDGSELVVSELFDETHSPSSSVDDFRPLLDETVTRMLRKVHNAYSGHLSEKHALWLLRKNGITWPQMEQDVKLFIASCEACQLSQDRLGSSNPSLGSTRANELFQIVAVDTITKLPKDGRGNTAIFVFVCCFSNFVELIPAPDKSARSAANALLQVCGRYGVPEYLRSDRGKEYVNNIITALLKSIECEEDFTLPYSPSSKGLVERRNKEVIRHLKALMVVKDQLKESWSEYLPLIQHILNSAPSGATGLSPMVTMYGTRITPLRALFKKPVTEIDTSKGPTPAWVKEKQAIQFVFIEAQRVYKP